MVSAKRVWLKGGWLLLLDITSTCFIFLLYLNYFDKTLTIKCLIASKLTLVGWVASVGKTFELRKQSLKKTREAEPE